MKDRGTLMKEIGETSFMVNDLTLYLDTHPTDAEALECFSAAMKRRKELLQTYAEQYEPLTMDCVCPNTNNQSGSNTEYPKQKHFTWIDGPMPWEGGAVI